MNRTEAIGSVKQGYTDGTRRLASRYIGRLARTRVSPNALTAGGVLLCTAAAVAIPFEDRNKFLFYWLAAVAGSFLVSYARAKAELIGLKGDVGIGSRAERVAVIASGLILAPFGVPLEWFIYLLAAAAWLTVLQRILSVRKQLLGKEANGFDQR